MNHYQQSLVIEADPAAVYAALTTPAGLRGWWTRDCDVPSDVGDSVHVRFDRGYKDLRIDRLLPFSEVRWHCTRAQLCADVDLARKDEWVGTEVIFRLMPEGVGRTRVHFEHVGLVPELECYGMCSKGWRYFLGSLQQFAETGCGTPYIVAEEAIA